MNKFMTALAAAALSCLSAAPQTSAPYSDIVRQILANNPGLAAENAAMEAELAQRNADNVLPDPEVEFERSWASRQGVDNKWSIGVSQDFEWPGAYRARSAANRARRNAIDYIRQSLLLDKAMEVRRLLIDWGAARQRISHYRTLVTSMDSLVCATSRAFDHGEATLLDIRKLRLKSLSLAARADEVEATARSIREQLTALNGGKALDLSQVSWTDGQPPLLPEDAYIDMFYMNDPMLMANTARQRAAGSDVAEAKASAFPGFKIGYVHSFEEGTHFNGLSLGVSLPIYSRSKRRAAADLLLEETASTSLSYELTTRADIIATYARAKGLRRQLEAYRETLSDDYADILTQMLDGGQITILEYITEISFYVECLDERLSLEQEYLSALARLNRWEY